MQFTEKSHVWDLHIHTNKCPKGSNEFIKSFGENTKEFIDNLLNVLIINDKKRVEMISFTDHNQISIDVYKEFYKRNTDIKLIPGVEIDCIIDEKKDHKHLIVYFECGYDQIEEIGMSVNSLLKKTRENGELIELTKLFEKLIKIGCNFIVSPHAFKQDKRAINFEWDNEEYTQKVAPMYMDQFFVFWEASGHTTIQKAKEFLEDFKLDEKISIVSFSDSDNFAKLDEYLSNPPQYFHSLPTFKGLAMVGTDSSRIRGKETPFDQNRNPGMIYEVDFNDIKIKFSPQLNSIIGGRGSGKSVLLDSIALKIGYDGHSKKRKDFLSKFPISIKNFNNSEVNSEFAIDYFNQAYVSDLFSNDNFGENLKSKFLDSFSALRNLNSEVIQRENKTKFDNLITQYETKTENNLDAFNVGFHVINNDGLNLKIYAKDKFKNDKNNQLLDYTKEIDRIESYFDQLPIQIKASTELLKLKAILQTGIINEIYKYNFNAIRVNYSKNIFIDKYLNAKKSKTEAATKKSKIEDDIKSKIDYLSYEAKFRNIIINAYFKIAEGLKLYHSEYAIEHGSERNRFIFSNEITIESPLDHIISIFVKNVDSRKIEVGSNNLVKICKMYINGSLKNYLKDTITLENINIDLLKFDLEYTHVNNIYYVDDNKQIMDIMVQSPGTQTNILMEYIVYKRTNKPLLIDQPEDNIDNKTIYDKLRKWFTKLKSERQVIVVTHDANIVINADAENVIIAEQIDSDKFVYHYGALEYQKIIEEASTILDGGKEAVKRRLIKYES